VIDEMVGVRPLVFISACPTPPARGVSLLPGRPARVSLSWTVGPVEVGLALDVWASLPLIVPLIVPRN
jgi:hypothetical protein